MLHEPHVSSTSGNLEWYAEPLFEDGPIIGTFRHVNCLQVAYKGALSNGTCGNCAKIESLNTFRCKVKRRARSGEDGISSDAVPHQFLSHSELCQRLRESRSKEEQLYHKTFLLPHELQRANKSKDNKKKKFQEICAKGNFGEIACNVSKAVREKKLAGKEGVLDLLKTISNNLPKDDGSRGKRYKNCETTTEFYKLILMMFGPKACSFVADNLVGPHVHTVQLWRNCNLKTFSLSDPAKVFKLTATIYKSLKEKVNEDGKVPFLFMEDETAIEQHIKYKEKTDNVYGYCGRKEEGHTCEDHYTFKVNTIMYPYMGDYVYN